MSHPLACLQTCVTDNPDIGFPGQCREIRNSVTAIYPGSTEKQVVKIDVGAVDTAADYAITMDGYSTTLTAADAANPPSDCVACVGDPQVTFVEALLAKLRSDSKICAHFTVTVDAGNPNLLCFENCTPGDAKALSITGGAAALVSSTTPAMLGNLPWGRVAVLTGAIDDCITVGLPKDNTSKILGVTVGSSTMCWNPHSTKWGDVPSFGPGMALSIVRDGSINMKFESPATVDQDIYYRYAADGDLVECGMLSTAGPGAGLELLPNACLTGPTQMTSSGCLIAPVDIALP